MFLHRYAIAVGVPVPILAKIMSSSDITEAMAFERIHPFGEDRADIRCGIITSTIANINRKSGSRPYKIHDFIPKFEKPKPKSMKRRFIEALNGNNS